MAVKKTGKTPPKKAEAKKATGTKNKLPVKETKAKTREPKENMICSFCGREPDENRQLIAGPNNVNICDECVTVSMQILAEHSHLNMCPLSTPRTAQALEVVGSELQEHPAFRIRMKYDVLYLSPKNQFSEKIYNQVLPVAEKHKIKVKHFSEIINSKLSFDKEILDIYNAFFVIVDINGKDPDIMYFLGMLHLMGKPIVILAQNADDIPKSLRKNFFIPCKNDAKTIEIVTQHFQSVFLSIKRLKKLTKGKVRMK